MKKIVFSKMVATGNDFIVVDNRGLSMAGILHRLAKKLCDRRLGVGADGLLVVERSRKADFKMRILNPDGSEPDMCGNGSRCIALYANMRKIAPARMAIETKAGLLTASVRKDVVRINMTDPKGLKCSLAIKSGKKSYQLHYVDTGVPHAVWFVDHIDKVDVAGLGMEIRFHRSFRPKGTNVDFVMLNRDSSISVRTYERGVEAETLACGTGAVASAIISAAVKGLGSPVNIHAQGGDLKVYFKDKTDRFREVFLEGKAREVFTGQLSIDP